MKDRSSRSSEVHAPVRAPSRLRVAPSGSSDERAAHDAAADVERGRAAHGLARGAESVGAVAAAPASVDDALHRPGAPLPGETRAAMEQRFGHDFGKVRIHSDHQSATAANDLRARAFAVGDDIVFGEGQFAPQTAMGARVLTHELAHVVQQQGRAPVVQRYDMDNAPWGDPQRDWRLRQYRTTPNPNAPVEVTAIDDTDTVGMVENWFTLGEVNFTDVPSMVTNVLAHLRTRSMTRLNIQVHGSPTHAQIGSSVVTTATFPTHRPQLSRLAGRFTSGGFVHLRACNVGQNPPLLQSFASAFGVPVYAGTGTQRNLIYPWNTGSYLRCDSAACAPASRP